MRGEIRYQKELQKTYMIAAQCKKEMIDSYAGQMVLRNRLEGMVPCEVQLLDGKREIWYDISFLQTVEQVFAVKEMHFLDLKNLILQILYIIEEMEKYLIDSRQLCFEPEFLYWDMEKDQVKLLYNYTEEEAENGISTLAGFLLERTCHEEEKAVDLAYYFYEQTQKENFLVEKIEAYVEKTGENRELEIKKIKQEPESEKLGNHLEEAVFDTEVKKEATEKKKKETKQRGYIWENKSGLLIETGLATSVTALLSGVGYAVTRQYFFLEQMEELLWFAGSVLLFTAGLAFSAFGILKKRREGRGICNKTENDIKNDKEQKQGDPFLEELELWQQEGRQAAQESTDGKTVYMGKGSMNREYHLVEMKKGLEKIYDIPGYPFLIGKDKERVNLTVKEYSVSRIHARLTEEEGTIYLEDLHSTNGTYLNDLLLEPHNKIKLKRGDMILFGNAEFVFR
ncbi:MAG: FHA domain-containing protein [Lachnospiraceae bacterium]|jgi:hypothetical protein|nr:FHA domain-containing protein [Lachnospiraceae bacterium]